MNKAADEEMSMEELTEEEVQAIAGKGLGLETLATFTCTVVVRKLKVLKLRPTNNDAGSHTVKRQAQTTSTSGCHC